MWNQLIFFGCVFHLIQSRQSALVHRTDPHTGLQWIGPIRNCGKGIKSNDDALNSCLGHIVNDLAPMVANGIEELNLQPLDPIRLDYSHKQNLGPVNFRVEAKNMSIHHLTTFTKLEFHSNTKKRTLRFEYAVPKISVDANYVLSGRAFFFPLIGSGPAHIDIHNMRVEGRMHFRKVKNVEGDDVLQLDQTVINQMLIGGMNVNIRGLFDGSPLWAAVSHYIGNRYGLQIFDSIRPEVTKYTGDIITNTLLNPILFLLPSVAEFVPDH